MEQSLRVQPGNQSPGSCDLSLLQPQKSHIFKTLGIAGVNPRKKTSNVGGCNPLIMKLEIKMVFKCGFATLYPSIS